MIEEIRAEMAASVISVDVAAGMPVSAGQMLLLLESMKMEIPVNAEDDGVLRHVAVAVGDSVRRGDLLAEVDAAIGGCSDAPRAEAALWPGH
jgi:acetyl-CoA carboxylase biotin carboxyl carrier protein